MGVVMITNKLRDKGEEDEEEQYMDGDFTDTPFDEENFPEPLEFTVLLKFAEDDEK